MSSAEKNSAVFVGLGMMGWPMAASLVRNGFKLNLVDAVDGKAEQFATEVGGKAFASIGDALGDTDTIILILPSSKEVNEVVSSIEDQLRPGMVIIDMTSGSPTVTREIAKRLEPKGVDVVDAPVSGGAVRAKTGELAIMIGATDEAYAKADPYLQAMGTALHRVGLVGAGQTVKALNNLVYSAGVLIAVEALLIGQRAGVDPAKIVDVLNSGTGGNGGTRVMMKQQVLSRSFKPAFRLDLMLKDLTIATDLARETKTTAPYTLQCRETWSAASAVLGPGHDNSAIARFCEMMVGDVLSSPSVEKVESA